MSRHNDLAVRKQESTSLSNLISTPSLSTKLPETQEENETVTVQNIRPSIHLTPTPTVAMPSTSRQQIISPEMIRPFSKAGPRKNTTRNNRKMSSAIVTNTPEKKKLEEKERNAKKSKNIVKKSATKQSVKTLNRKSKRHQENFVLQSDSDSSDSIVLTEVKKRLFEEKQRKIVMIA